MIEVMKIGELANLAGVQVETIRHYEREGLLPHTRRSEGNYRVYDETHGQRLSFIRHCRSLDMTLDEIRVLLRFRDAPTENCGEVNALLHDHIDHGAHRVKELRQLEKQLKGLRELCRSAQDAEHCGILNELNVMSQKQSISSDMTGHVHGAHAGVRTRKSHA
jgi:Cd(II)/Pb(II)-responsive transcriptional regulator